MAVFETMRTTAHLRLFARATDEAVHENKHSARSTSSDLCSAELGTPPRLRLTFLYCRYSPNSLPRFLASLGTSSIRQIQGCKPRYTRRHRAEAVSTNYQGEEKAEARLFMSLGVPARELFTLLGALNSNGCGGDS